VAEESFNLQKEGAQFEVGAPKRPLSPFIFFSQEARRVIRNEKPDLH
jgi:hypothetical protein